MTSKFERGEADDLEGSPWWWRAVVRVGVPTAVSVAVVYYGGQFIMGELRDNMKSSQAVNERVEELLKHHIQTDAILVVDTEYRTRLLQRICMNTALPAERNSCFSENPERSSR